MVIALELCSVWVVGWVSECALSQVVFQPCSSLGTLHHLLPVHQICIFAQIVITMPNKQLRFQGLFSGMNKGYCMEQDVKITFILFVT